MYVSSFNLIVATPCMRSSKGLALTKLVSYVGLERSIYTFHTIPLQKHRTMNNENASCLIILSTRGGKILVSSTNVMHNLNLIYNSFIRSVQLHIIGIALAANSPRRIIHAALDLSTLIYPNGCVHGRCACLGMCSNVETSPTLHPLV